MDPFTPPPSQRSGSAAASHGRLSLLRFYHWLEADFVFQGHWGDGEAVSQHERRAPTQLTAGPQTGENTSP